MLAQSTSLSTEEARRTKRSKFTMTKATKPIPATRNIAGGSAGAAENVEPSARDRRDGEQERDSQRAAATGDGKDAGEQHKGKQTRDNESSTFDCFDKGAKKKSNARAISSWSIEKRRSPNRCRVAFIDSFACAVSLIQF